MDKAREIASEAIARAMRNIEYATDMKRALIEAFPSNDGRLAPQFSTGSIRCLEQAGLVEPFGAWGFLTPLGLAVRAILLEESGDVG